MSLVIIFSQNVRIYLFIIKIKNPSEYIYQTDF